MPSNISSYSKEFIIFTSLQAPAIPQNVASDLESRSLRSPLCFLRASCAHLPILGSLLGLATVWIAATVGIAPNNNDELFKHTGPSQS